MSKKYLYYFSEGNDAFGGDKVTMKNTLGGKGAGLAEMTAAGAILHDGKWPAAVSLCAGTNAGTEVDTDAGWNGGQ